MCLDSGTCVWDMVLEHEESEFGLKSDLWGGLRGVWKRMKSIVICDDWWIIGLIN